MEISIGHQQNSNSYSQNGNDQHNQNVDMKVIMKRISIWNFFLKKTGGGMMMNIYWLTLLVPNILNWKDQKEGLKKDLYP